MATIERHNVILEQKGKSQRVLETFFTRREAEAFEKMVFKVDKNSRVYVQTVITCKKS